MPDVSKHRGGGASRHGDRWRARARIDGKTISLGLFDTQEEAEAEVRETLRQLGAGDLALPGTTTLGEWGLEVLDRRERGRGRRSVVAGVRQERSVWRTHVLHAPIAEMHLRSITRPMIVAWLDALVHETTGLRSLRGRKPQKTERPLSRGTIQHALRLLRTVLGAGVDAGKLDANPARDVKLPRLDRAEDAAEAWSWLTLEEIARLIGTPEITRGRQGARKASTVRTEQAEVPEELRIAWTVAIYAGLRPPSELLRLRWRDVLELDGAHPRIRVLASKTEAGREVPLLPPAARALRRMKELTPGVGSAPVFRLRKWKRGKVVEIATPPRSWDLGWRRWGIAILGRHARLYDLRHTCASHLVQGSWGRSLSLYEVAAWLGHSSVSVTQRYAHLAPEGLRGVAAELARAMEPEGVSRVDTSGHPDTTPIR
jgi:integrase